MAEVQKDLQWHPAFFAGIQIELEDESKNRLYRPVMDIIVRANKEQFLQVKKMCEALEELMADKFKAKF